ncbi:hypothetical protein Tco_0879857 [Tanacetum coccineum]
MQPHIPHHFHILKMNKFPGKRISKMGYQKTSTGSGSSGGTSKGYRNYGGYGGSKGYGGSGNSGGSGSSGGSGDKTDTFAAWMELNKTDTFAQTLLYVEIPKFYTWNQQDRIWQSRQRGQTLGRIHHVPPSWDELFYLRILLNKVRGPVEWDDLKEFNDVVYLTYREACYAHGLLEDDKEYIDGLLKARE